MGGAAAGWGAVLQQVVVFAQGAAALGIPAETAQAAVGRGVNNDAGSGGSGEAAGPGIGLLQIGGKGLVETGFGGFTLIFVG